MGYLSTNVTLEGIIKDPIGGLAAARICEVKYAKTIVVESGKRWTVEIGLKSCLAEFIIQVAVVSPCVVRELSPNVGVDETGANSILAWVHISCFPDVGISVREV